MTIIKTAYQCSPTGIYIGETLVQEDPLHADTYLLPPACTLDAPPAFDPGRQVPVLNDGVWKLRTVRNPVVAAPDVSTTVPTEANRPEAGAHEIALIVDGQWKVVPDFRDTVYWLADGSEHRIVAIGVLPPEDALSSPPAPPPPQRTLAQVQAAQVATLLYSGQAAIGQPVVYTTIAGHTDTFATDAESVSNLKAALTTSRKARKFEMDLWLNSAGVPVMPFSFGDLEGLARAVDNRPAPDYRQLLEKVVAVMQAPTVEAVHAITW